MVVSAALPERFIDTALRKINGKLFGRHLSGSFCDVK